MLACLLVDSFIGCQRSHQYICNQPYMFGIFSLALIQHFHLILAHQISSINTSNKPAHPTSLLGLFVCLFVCICKPLQSVKTLSNEQWHKNKANYISCGACILLSCIYCVTLLTLMLTFLSLSGTVAATMLLILETGIFFQIADSSEFLDNFSSWKELHFLSLSLSVL